MYLRIVLCYIAVIALFKSSNADPIVTLKNPRGSVVQGHIMKTDAGHDIYAYQDIPYAEPPIGRLRFQKPVMNRGWQGTLRATQNRKYCLQGHSNQPNRNYTEDCLVLNVYSPTAPNSGQRHAVLLYIHGGGFSGGSGSYDDVRSDYFVEEGIVMVAINYRLGAIGFLSTGDNVIPPNNGLYDQQLAIQWVHENIEAFGGDPNNIVISGESAGSVSVSYQLIGTTPRNFHGAIMSSGVSLCPFGYGTNVRQGAEQFVHALNPSFNARDSHSILQFLQSVSTDQLAHGLGRCGYFFSPTITNGGDDYGVPPCEAFDNGQTKRLPTLTGFNSEEYFTFYGGLQDIKNRAAARDRSCTMDWRYNILPQDRERACLDLKRLYTQSSFANDLPAFIRFTTDEQFVRPIIRSVKGSSRHVPNTYLYELSYNPSMGSHCPVPGMPGVGHGADLYLLFGAYGAHRYMNPQDRVISKRMVRMWANFVKYKNPTPHNGDSVLGNLKFPAVQPDKVWYMNIDTNMQAAANPRGCDRWPGVLDHYFHHPITIY